MKLKMNNIERLARDISREFHSLFKQANVEYVISILDTLRILNVIDLKSLISIEVEYE